jgi:hypothetical protein
VGAEWPPHVPETVQFKILRHPLASFATRPWKSQRIRRKSIRNYVLKGALDAFPTAINASVGRIIATRWSRNVKTGYFLPLIKSRISKPNLNVCV